TDVTHLRRDRGRGPRTHPRDGERPLLLLAVEQGSDSRVRSGILWSSKSCWAISGPTSVWFHHIVAALGAGCRKTWWPPTNRRAVGGGAMGLERYVVEAVILEGRSRRDVARSAGISKGWVDKL